LCKAARTFFSAVLFLSMFCSAWAGPMEDFKTATTALDRGDYATALRLFRSVAAQGFPGAKWALGTMYFEGKGVLRDYVAALTWHRQAADQGHPLSQQAMGAIYDRGLGVNQNHTEAAKWFRRAAEQGYGMAQVNLGAMYSVGEGIPQDYVEAYKWFSIAAAGGGYLDTKSNEPVKSDAAKRRDEIARRLTPAQLADAQRLVQKWKPKAEPSALANAATAASRSPADIAAGEATPPLNDTKSAPHAEMREGDAWNTGSVFAAGSLCEAKGFMAQGQTTPLIAFTMQRLSAINAQQIRDGYQEGLKRSAVYSRNAGRWVPITITQESCGQIDYAIKQYKIGFDALR
jgi:TPR repeat protein